MKKIMFTLLIFALLLLTACGQQETITSGTFIAPQTDCGCNEDCSVINCEERCEKTPDCITQKLHPELIEQRQQNNEE